MEKICYVIMPYGGDDPELKTRYRSIYSAIIKPAVESKGYRCVREDHESRQGNIGTNIIKSLATAELVIADLSDNNWNVAYELGIRHSLSKSGTILLIDDSTKIMFDIQSNKIITYKEEWYTCIDEIQNSIVSTIDYYETNRTSSDSPVHDIYDDFPVKLIDYLSNNNDEEKKIINKLTQENAKLSEALNNAGISLDGQTERSDVVFELKQALGKSQYSGTNALIKLRDYANAGDEERFVDFLGQVLTKGFVTEDNCDEIYFMCQRLNNYFIMLAFLEEIVKRFPENGEFSGRLAREYSKNSSNRDKAISTVNKLVGVKRIDNKYVLEKKALTYNILGAFFDVYIQMDKHEDMREIALELLKMYPSYSDLIKRNIVTAYIESKDFEQAEAIAKQLVDENGEDDLNVYTLYKVYRNFDIYDKAYETIEKCIAMDPADEDYCIVMAGLIADSCCIRDFSTGEIVKVSKDRATAVLVPFVFYVYDLNNNQAQRCYAFLQRNKLIDACAYFKESYESGMHRIPRSDDYDYSALEYIFKNK